MRIQPRQQLLDIWRSTARASFPDNAWSWGGRDGSNSISDAEQLLSVILPATGFSSFRFDTPDRTDEDVLAALHILGNAGDIPLRVVRVLGEYFERYSTTDGVPQFSGGSLFTAADPDENVSPSQRSLEVVESYSVSVTLTLASIGFTRRLTAAVSRPELKAEIARVESLASQRLTAALVGLLRSFAVNAFDVDSDYGHNLVSSINRGKPADRRFLNDLNDALRDTTASLRDLTIGSGIVKDLDSPSRLYECGWSWGVVVGAPELDFVSPEVVPQADGIALDAPFLYFTVVALDGLAELFSADVRRQGLLNDLQLRLAAALNLRWDITQAYWSTIATFGNGGLWPLEDLPWLTTDGAQSDYFSLLVTSISTRNLAEQRGTDADLSRIGRVLEELAERSRITRRPNTGGSAVALHDPGVEVGLDGTEQVGPALTWVATDFAPLLLKRAIRVAGLINDIDLRVRLLDLVDNVWFHVLSRRHFDKDERDAWRGLWDQPSNVFPQIGSRFKQPSWHHTVRVVECLVSAAGLIASNPLRAEEVVLFAGNLVSEADHLLDQEQLAGSTEAGSALRAEVLEIRAAVRRARDILETRPASATALLLDALRRLDQLAAARQDVIGGP
jgi:hypothetical protein